MFKRKCEWIGCLVICFIFLCNSRLVSQNNSLIISWDPNSEADLMGYKVYYGLSSKNYNRVIDVGNQTRYTVEGLSEEVNYYFAVTAYDSAFNESDFSEEVIGYIQGNYREKPAIAQYEIIDKTHVAITFSKPVTKESSENVNNYSISDNIQVISAALDNNQITVRLTTSAHEYEKDYILTVHNILDTENPPNQILENSQVTYELHKEDNIPPEVLSVTLTEPTKLHIQFNEPVTRASAENIEHYKINKDIQIQSALLDPNETLVNLITIPHRNGETYTLTIEQIKDKSDNEIEGKSYTYHFVAVDTIKPQIEEVLILDNEHLDVIFSEQIDRETAEDENNYSIDNVENEESSNSYEVFVDDKSPISKLNIISPNKNYYPSSY